MKKLAIVAIVAVLGCQLLALANPDRRVALWLGAVAAATVLLVARWFLVRAAASSIDDSRARDPAESLRRWLSKTEILIARADSTRSDWDKYLRPMLARQFELATGRRKGKDPRVFHATALALFGERLWQWVDPDDVSPTGAGEPGPGREVLAEVLQRLEAI
ncbi:hypothetical protein MMAD_52930 [Mycolicibacterium madagascariense]|uniref:Uncharacterized protein n=1 Tax=Mycolicibacterium madagascariense TaxID=212765 RepID=A0A7I7XP20_9MYCO|nr:hypothetical protein [Mycolicibacterium madagascariense]MCV7015493.1 hypothetical protein [Mycolicibacterium madagascariense]BBZ30998.1 hypothetical protein MMAD_52930 [Mycolicibacterium madagascariense]